MSTQILLGQLLHQGECLFEKVFADRRTRAEVLLRVLRENHDEVLPELLDQTTNDLDTDPDALVERIGRLDTTHVDVTPHLSKFDVPDMPQRLYLTLTDNEGHIAAEAHTSAEARRAALVERLQVLGDNPEDACDETSLVTALVDLLGPDTRITLASCEAGSGTSSWRPFLDDPGLSHDLISTRGER